MTDTQKQAAMVARQRRDENLKGKRGRSHRPIPSSCIASAADTWAHVFDLLDAMNDVHRELFSQPDCLCDAHFRERGVGRGVAWSIAPGVAHQCVEDVASQSSQPASTIDGEITAQGRAQVVGTEFCASRTGRESICVRSAPCGVHVYADGVFGSSNYMYVARRTSVVMDARPKGTGVRRGSLRTTSVRPLRAGTDKRQPAASHLAPASKAPRESSDNSHQPVFPSCRATMTHSPCALLTGPDAVRDDGMANNVRGSSSTQPRQRHHS
ncbi:hypothetical protein BKA81DRAFT_426399 [Phyllosticta paracitricarpa]